MARGLGVRVEEGDLGETLLGLTLDDAHMLLNRTLRGSRRILVFAHELAHVYRRRGWFQGISVADEEWFADWFARELVLPRRWLSPRWPRTHLGSIHVDIETVALQMSVTQRAPALMRNGRHVLCRKCGTNLHDWHCDCRRLRNGSEDPLELPDVRELHVLYSPSRQPDSWLSLSCSGPAALPAVA